MEVKTQNIVNGISDGTQDIVNEGGHVLPPSDSHKKHEVGIHWLRISFENRYLQHILKFLRTPFGQADLDGYGLWSYDSRYAWKNKASLNFDSDKERAAVVHLNRCTLDIPGSALDELQIKDLLLLIEFFNSIDGKCSRLDVFYDDYERLVSFEELREVAEKGDFSGFRKYGTRDGGMRCDDGTIKNRNEVNFGSRGQRGNGKYLRVYDKELESDGEKKCTRWETEFTQERADIAFKALSQCCDDENCFALLCGSLIAGTVTFIHRTGDKNISRLEKYDWWEKICWILGGVVNIRVVRERDTIERKIAHVERNCSSSLACMRKAFITDRHFYEWINEVCIKGEEKMNNSTRNITEENKRSLFYMSERIGKLTPETRIFALQLYKD